MSTTGKFSQDRGTNRHRFVFETAFERKSAVRPAEAAAGKARTAKLSHLRKRAGPYVLAVLTTSLTLALRMNWEITEGAEHGLELFFVPIAVSGFFGGLGPGLLATLLTGVYSNYFLLHHHHGFSLPGTLDGIEWGIVLLGGAVVSVFNESLHRARRRSDAMLADRNRTEAELQWKTAFLEAQVESSSDGILVVDSNGKKILQNERMNALWRIPMEIADDPDDSKQVEFVKSRVKDPDGFSKRVAYLYAHPDETSHEEIELKDGWILDRYSCPVIGKDGTHYGRIWTFRDITARKKSEMRLKESQTRLELALESSLMGTWSLDLRSGLTIWDEASAKLFGRSREQLCIGGFSDFLKILHPEDAPRLQEFHQSLLRDGSHETTEYRIVRPDGTVIWIEARIHVERDATGNALQLFGACMDITQRKRGQAAIENRLQLETRLSRIASALPGVIYEFRMQPDGRMVMPFAGAAMQEVFGISARRFEEDFGAGLRLIHPGDLDRVIESIHLSAQTVSVWHHEFRVNHPVKGEIWIEGRSTPQREAGGGILWHGFLHDVTERRRAEADHARLVTAVEQAAEMVVITDIEGVILYVNPAFEKVTGYSMREAVGKNPRMLSSGKHDAAYYRRLWQTIRRGETWSGRIVNKKKDGTLYEEEMTISPVVDATGKITNFVAVKRDVTREASLEAQLRQSQKLEAIGQLAGGVAHDFNNILMVIQGNASLLQSNEAHLTPTEAADCTSQIIEASKRAATLTRQLLLFSRKQVMQPALLNLDGVVTGMLKMLRRILGEDISLQSEFAPGVPAIFADPGMIEQVLLNLAVNSRDAMPSGGSLLIETSLTTVDETRAKWNAEAAPGRYVVLSVTDTGSGIPPEVLPRIFEPFFTTKEVGKGTGLGLATVHGIVKQHKGWIEVISEPGKGTTFRVFLPASETQRSRCAEEEANYPMPRGDETILVAEDEPRVRHLLTTVLESCGYKVLCASSGVVALQIWHENKARIQLLLTDLVMPDGVSGSDLAAMIHAENPALRVIYTSGYSADIAKKLPLIEGDNFLQKPCPPHKLAQTVRKCLDRN